MNRCYIICEWYLLYGCVLRCVTICEHSMTDCITSYIVSVGGQMLCKTIALMVWGSVGCINIGGCHWIMRYSFSSAIMLCILYISEWEHLLPSLSQKHQFVINTLDLLIHYKSSCNVLSTKGQYDIEHSCSAQHIGYAKPNMAPAWQPN